LTKRCAYLLASWAFFYELSVKLPWSIKTSMVYTRCGQ
jgi:hypothetical protein